MILPASALTAPVPSTGGDGRAQAEEMLKLAAALRGRHLVVAVQTLDCTDGAGDGLEVAGKNRGDGGHVSRR